METKNPDTPLLKLSPDDAFTLRDACASVNVFGEVGSGKTSGSTRGLAETYLRGGKLVLNAKEEI